MYEINFFCTCPYNNTSTELLEHEEILDVAANITSEIVRSILQLTVPSESSTSTTRTIVIAVVVPVGVVGIAVLTLLVALLLRWRSQRYIIGTERAFNIWLPQTPHLVVHICTPAPVILVHFVSEF